MTSQAFVRLVHSLEYYIFDCNLNIKKVDIVLLSPLRQSGRKSQVFDMLLTSEYYVFDCNLNIKES